MFKDYSDSELLACYQEKKSEAAIAELYNRYAVLLYGVCLNYISDKIQAKNIVNESFVHLCQTPEAIKMPKYWLLTVAKNKCISELRRNNIELPKIPIEKINEKNTDFYVENESLLRLMVDDDSERDDALHDILKSLPPLQAECLKLFYWKKQTYKQIAATLNIAPATVKSQLQTAKIHLKKRLSN
jgi:RNA polymerase sigma factor, sigma-70 family